ncbi:MAG: hypothetical protein IKQ40_07655 [Lachnospiraceae bacterium]|nr:hypothetical protein [Lachnospiraceae bacterium]
MLKAICLILFVVMFFKLLGIAFRVGWGILKISIYLVLFPMIVLTLIFGGLFFIALPVILIAGVTGIAAGA